MNCIIFSESTSKLFSSNNLHFLFGKQLLCLSLVFITMYFWIVSLKTLKVINLLQLWGLSVPQGCNLSQQEDSTSFKVIGFFFPISSPILSYISLSLTGFDYLSVDYCLTVLYSTTSFSLTVSQFRHSVMSNSLWSMNCQDTRPPCPLPTPGVHPTRVHWVGGAIKQSHPLSSPSSPALNLSQHQGLFQWVRSSPQVAKVLEFQLHH